MVSDCAISRKLPGGNSSEYPRGLKLRQATVGYQELDIYMYMTLSIINMDFLYQFNLRLIAPLFTVSFHEMFEKKKFKCWQVCDWLAKCIIMLRFMDLRWPRVFRRSSVGLVKLWSSILVMVLRKLLSFVPFHIIQNSYAIKLEK